MAQSPNPYKPAAVTDSRAANGGPEPRNVHRFAKPLVFLLLLGAFYLVSQRYGDELTFQSLAQREVALTEYESRHPFMVFGAAILLYVVVSGLSIPAVPVVLSLVYGSHFGWLRAVAIVSIGSTAGATVCFLLSRYLFRDVVQRRFADQLVTFNRKLGEEGAFYLFTLRLIFAVPFFMVNLVMGLTNMKWTTYWWVSQIGMLPGTMAYVYAGSTLKLQDLAENGFQGIGWQTLLAFCILGILPITIKKILGRWRPTKGTNPVPGG